jgi:glycosyltransferase involved in cell wall biosynthesis
MIYHNAWPFYFSKNDDKVNLVVISDCIHYQINDKIGNKNAIFSKQMDMLFKDYSQIILVAPLNLIDVELNNLSFYSDSTYHKLRYFPTKNVGGNSLAEKFNLLVYIPAWIKLFYSLRHNDMFYLRMPNNLNLISFLIYWFLKKKMFITYTGTWESYSNEPLTYKVQKFFIKYLMKGPAYVYDSTNSIQYRNLITSFSPSYSDSDFLNQKVIIEEKIALVSQMRLKKLEFLSVGSIVKYKNQLLGIKLIEKLHNSGFKVRLKIAGSGSGNYLDELKQYVLNKNLKEVVIFVGYKNWDELTQLYCNTNFILHTPIIEGYGKVIQESLSYGIIPIMTNFPYADFFLGKENKRGLIIKNDETSFQCVIDFLNSILDDENKWREIILNCYNFSGYLTLERWAEDYKKVRNED